MCLQRYALQWPKVCTLLYCTVRMVVSGGRGGGWPVPFHQIVRGCGRLTVAGGAGICYCCCCCTQGWVRGGGKEEEAVRKGKRNVGLTRGIGTNSGKNADVVGRRRMRRNGCRLCSLHGTVWSKRVTDRLGKKPVSKFSSHVVACFSVGVLRALLQGMG